MLSQVLRTAIADGRSGLAATVATLLGRIVDRDDLATGGRPDPLVEALSAPDRRVQFAAAESLVRLDPRRAFSGSSRVVPILTRFLATQGRPGPWWWMAMPCGGADGWVPADARL